MLTPFLETGDTVSDRRDPAWETLIWGLLGGRVDNIVPHSSGGPVISGGPMVEEIGNLGCVFFLRRLMRTATRPIMAMAPMTATTPPAMAAMPSPPELVLFSPGLAAAALELVLEDCGPDVPDPVPAWAVGYVWATDPLCQHCHVHHDAASGVLLTRFGNRRDHFVPGGLAVKVQNGQGRGDVLRRRGGAVVLDVGRHRARHQIRDAVFQTHARRQRLGALGALVPRERVHDVGDARLRARGQRAVLGHGRHVVCHVTGRRRRLWESGGALVHGAVRIVEREAGRDVAGIGARVPDERRDGPADPRRVVVLAADTRRHQARRLGAEGRHGAQGVRDARLGAGRHVGVFGNVSGIFGDDVGRRGREGDRRVGVAVLAEHCRGAGLVLGC